MIYILPPIPANHCGSMILDVASSVMTSVTENLN